MLRSSSTSLFLETALPAKTYEAQIAALQEGGQPIPAELRFQLFKECLKINKQKPEKVCTNTIKIMFDHDAAFLIATVKKWENKKEEAALALKNIDEYLRNADISKAMSFQSHAYHCFCLSALISGRQLDELDAAYNKQIKTMVTGTIHPGGEWTVKTEIENQYYAKYLFHVSENGLASVETLNAMTSFRVDENDPDSDYMCLRLVAVACDETVSFDGVPDCVSEDVLRHDFIHSGFLKYSIMHDPDRFYECRKKIGIMIESINADHELKGNKILRAEVQAAFFMWTHELTTSMFVHGWPRRLPKQYNLLHGQYASIPQMILRLASKVYIPELYSNEIVNEAGVLQSMNIEMECLKPGNNMTPHEQIKEVMSHLDNGYRYLNEKFDALYGYQSSFTAFFRRAYHCVAPAFSNLCKYLPE